MIVYSPFTKQNTMKYILACCAFLCTIASDAQIVITQATLPIVYRQDTLLKTTEDSLFPDFSTGENQTWDMSLVSDTFNRVGNIIEISSSNFYDSSSSDNLSFLSYNYSLDHYVNLIGYYFYANRLQEQTFSLYSYTSNSFDTLRIYSQIDTFSGPCKLLPLPTSYGSAWNNVYVERLKYQLSLPLLGYDHTDGYRSRSVHERRSISGYGKMRVKDGYGVVGAYFDVLQVTATQVTEDSFFLNGLPMPVPLQVALNIVQGKKDTTYKQYYYRRHQLRPLTEVLFTDASYSTPVYAITQASDVIYNGVAAMDSYMNDIIIYPTPVTGNCLFVAGGNLTKGSSYQLIDVMGKCVQSGRAAVEDGSYKILINELVADGNYTLVLQDEVSGLNMRRLIVVNKQK